jgi:hypothetical protein
MVSAGLLQVNGRGEPVEFTLSRVDQPSGALWPEAGSELIAARALAVSLFETAQRTPLVLLCLASETVPRLFVEELRVQIPVCRVSSRGDGSDRGELIEEFAQGDDKVRLEWHPRVPGTHSPVRRLILSLATRDLLLEPFDRVIAGIDEELVESS